MRVDLLHFLRNLRRSPASAFAAILTLSLTLGASASIFAVVDAVLLTPPPFTDPDALVTIGETPLDDLATAPRAVGYGTFEAWRERAGSLATLEAFDGTNLTLTELGAAERLNAANVTPAFLLTLGVTPALGRSFGPDDVGRRVVIVSDAFWRRTLAGDPDVIGRELVLGGQSHTIVGVLPEQFVFELSPSDVWRPFPVTPGQAVRAGYRVRAVARLAMQISPATLGAALDQVSRASMPQARVAITPIASAIAGGATRMLGVLAGAAVLAMVIAFANLAGLLIVRSIDRRRELAVRGALGAPRFETARQLLLEAEALVALGTAGGVLLAVWMTPAVARLALEQFGGIANREVAISWRVMAGVALAAAACAWICASLPAFMAMRRNVVDELRRGATPPPRERTLRRAFVAGEVALAFVLIVSVALLGRSLFTVLAVNPGFEASGMLTMQVALPAARYPVERVVSFYASLQAALDERLGPRTSSIVDEIPLTHDRGRSLVSTRQTDPGREVVLRTAGAGYFEVMRIPLVAGRGFDRSDDASAPTRVVVSRSLAERLFPGGQPLGRQVWLAAPALFAEIIGIAGDVKHRSLDEASLSTIYVSASQFPSNGSILVVRSPRPDPDVIGAVREGVARLDRDLPVYNVRLMEDVLAASPGVPARRVLTAAFLGFAVLAVVLGVLGLFGVVAHDVAARSRELALRIALGAHPGRILGATVRQGASIVGVGLLAGSLLSVWAARAIGSVVAGTDQFDVLSAGVAAAVLIVTGACAVLPAALRAARTDPLIVLRAE